MQTGLWGFGIGVGFPVRTLRAVRMVRTLLRYDLSRQNGRQGWLIDGRGGVIRCYGGRGLEIYIRHGQP